MREGSHSDEIRLDSLLESYSCRGRVAQLGEHLLCKQGVTGSIPVTSTIFFSDCKRVRQITSARTPHYSCTLCTNCARTPHWSTSVHNGAVENASASRTGAISFARRLSFSRASRFIRNFIWEPPQRMKTTHPGICGSRRIRLGDAQTTTRHRPKLWMNCQVPSPLTVAVNLCSGISGPARPTAAQRYALTRESNSRKENGLVR